MGLFFPDGDEHFTEVRKTGFPRYREVLEGNWKDFLKVGFLTLLFYIPLAAGMAYAILSRSLIAAVLSGVVGGAIAGVGYACMVDLILRRLRDDLGDWWTVWKRAFRQNFRASIFPGVLQNTFFSVMVFGGAMMLWGALRLTPATIIFFLLASLVVLMIMTVWWPQIVLFEQSPLIQQKNALLFILMNPWKTLLSAVLQLVWWAVMFLFLPWTAFVVPFLGVWFILFLSLFLLYPAMDDAFRIEEQLNERFAGQRELREDTDESGG